MTRSKPIASIFSFFSGAGFLDLGFETSGYDVVYVNEIHKPFSDAYRHSRAVMHLPAPRYGFFEAGMDKCLDGPENEKLKKHLKEEASQGRLTGFIGGPPCPDFSIAGKNRGAEGDNGRLSKSYISLVCSLQPDFFIFENVKGLWRTKVHRAFYEHLKHELTAAGYLLSDRLLNAIEYGVPQDRDRIILFGIKKNLVPAGRRDILLDWDKHKPFTRKAVMAMGWPRIGKETSGAKPPKELTICHWFSVNDVKHHTNASHHFAPRAGLSKFQSLAEGDDSKKSYKRLHRDRYSPTAAYGNNEVHIHPTEARRISVAEALAIQSLPKEFELPPGMTLSNMFKTIGNGVPYLFARGIAATVSELLKKTVR